ncbi:MULTISPECIES: APC family permease [unclassified Ruegeria]|uniref:APC family permease n=1 Tax=unclassified Ruegeria TaxID=2625375 RepID=UPI0014891137|nr:MULTISPECIES: amino acid permease [unclassified Ruegeria]NOD76402.1 amino acid permease [Ruegeria sp. HKCCD4332]NOD89115.1 amino acid permease [Ruegeria sp. HKCCD4318]NOE13722.1 amino acid permease [Ruegeria sp. HKCCD4318-2]NOG07527.1 amino acid permease [Ruegeria sp. HKCCD4315]
MSSVDPNEQKLRRALTTPLLTLYGLGVTVGAGIYVLVGATADIAGPFAALSFVVAALVVSLTALSYAELATRFPVSAGEAAYVEAGFQKGWLAVFVGLAVAASGVISASAVAIGAASYLHALTGFAIPVLTISVVLIMGLIALWGITESVFVAAVITIIEIAGLLFVIGWGMSVQDPQGYGISSMLPPLEFDTWRGIFAASLLAFFAFVGFEDMANVAEEVKDPVRTIPKAILLTLVLATMLYLGTSMTVLLVVPIDVLSTSAAPLALVFSNAPEVIKQGFSAVAIVATVNGVLIQMIMASRVIYGLADRNHLPKVLAIVPKATQTPVIATLLVVAIIVLLTQTIPIGTLAERTSQIVLGVFVLVNISLILLKMQPDEAAKHFRVPIVVPILGVITSALLFGSGFL